MDVGPVDGDAALERRRLRAGPPEETLRWLLDELAAVEIVGLEMMPGGPSSATHRVRVRQRNGLGRTVVLRRYVLGPVVTETPDVAAREWTALGVVAPAPLPTPLPLAADLHGDVTDVPTIVMSWLEGRPVWDGRPRQRWLDQLVEPMIEVHAINIPAGTAVPPLERYEQRARPHAVPPPAGRLEHRVDVPGDRTARPLSLRHRLGDRQRRSIRSKPTPTEVTAVCRCHDRLRATAATARTGRCPSRGRRSR